MENQFVFVSFPYSPVILLHHRFIQEVYLRKEVLPRLHKLISPSLADTRRHNTQPLDV